MTSFKAFISYSHVADSRLAPALQHSLERFAKPWYRSRAIRVFRDVTNLSVSPHAWPDIENALRQSEFLILLASPAAAASKWVTKEVKFWLQHKSRETLLIVLTEGRLQWSEEEKDYDWTVTTSLPSSIGRRPDEPPLVEPLHLDFTSLSGHQLQIQHHGFLERVSSIAARLHGKSKDQIFGQHIREQHRKLQWVLGVAAMLICMLCVAGWQYYRAEVNAANARNEARISNAREAAARADNVVDRSPGYATDLALQGYSQLEGSAPPPELFTSLWRALGKSGGWPLTDAAAHSSDAVSFSSDGRLLAHDIGKGRIHIRDVADSLNRPPLVGEIHCGGNINSLLFLSNKLQIATESGGWTADFSAQPPGVTPWGNSQSDVAELIALRSSDRFLTVSGDHVLIRNLKGDVLWGLATGESDILATAVTPDETYCFIWTKTGLQRFNLASPDQPAESIPWERESAMIHAVSAQGDRVATYSTFDGIEVVDRHPDGTWHPRPFTKVRIVSSLAWTTDGEILAAGATEGLLLFQGPDPGRPRRIAGAHDGWVMKVSFVGDTHRLMTSGEDGTVRFWNADAMQGPIAVVQAHEEPANALMTDRDGAAVFTASMDTSIVHWDAESETDRVLARLNYLPAPLHALAYRSSGPWVFAASEDGTGRIWNINLPSPDSGLALPVVDSDGGGSQTVAVDNVSGAVVVNDEDGTVFVVSPDGHQIAEYHGHTSGYLDGVAFSADGKRLVTHDSEDGIRAWSLKGAEPHRRCPIDAVLTSVDFEFSAVPGEICLWSVNGVAMWNIEGSKETPLTWSADVITSPLPNGLVEVTIPYDANGRSIGRLPVIPQDRIDVFLQLLSRFHASFVHIDERHDRIIVEPDPGRIEVWSYGQSEPVMQHSLTLTAGGMAGECLIGSCAIGNGFLAVDDDQALVYVSMIEDDVWVRRDVLPERRYITTVDRFFQGQHVLVSFEDGPAEVWVFNKVQCDFDRKLVLPAGGSLINDTILVTAEEDRRQCAVYDLAADEPTLRNLPRAESPIDEYFATVDGKLLFTSHEDGSILRFPLSIDTIRQQLELRRKAAPSSPAWSINVGQDSSKGE